MKKSFPLLLRMAAAICLLAPQVLQADANTLANIQKDIKQVIQTVEPSIFSISARHAYQINKSQSSGQNHSSSSQTYEIVTMASGISIDSCHIITQTPAVAGARTVSVTLPDGSEKQGEVIGSDDKHGFSIIRVKNATFPSVSIANSDHVGTGSFVLIIGNSLGVSPVASLGFVNCLRSDGMIQISLNLAAGSTGGAVFNTKGQFVGILSPGMTRANSDYSVMQPRETILAYPANQIIQSMSSIIENGHKPNGYLGIRGEDWPGKLGGTHVVGVTPNSPADQAGLQVGDIILSFNSHNITATYDLARTVRHHQPNDSVQLRILRGHQVKTVNLELGQAPKNDQMIPFEQFLPKEQSMRPASNAGTSEQNFLLMRIHQLEKELKLLKQMVQ
ncbi:MAG: PDZ domain-containing protein [candidate division KSB1 bacterium]|nr:PDZ domain-containing protein [candidate division KSB1 bacterium]